LHISSLMVCGFINTIKKI